ncbi:MAG: hypothetical protein IPK30_10920 [Cellvibrionales bacterium]|nr:hypothetical protein [Cellvibrionales bacterium]
MSLPPMINPQFSGKSGEYVFDYDALMAFAESHGAGYRAAQPFPHIVVDDFVSDAISQQLQAGFPPADPALQERDNTSFVDEDTQRIPAQKTKWAYAMNACLILSCAICCGKCNRRLLFCF